MEELIPLLKKLEPLPTVDQLPMKLKQPQMDQLKFLLKKLKPHHTEEPSPMSLEKQAKVDMFHTQPSHQLFHHQFHHQSHHQAPTGLPKVVILHIHMSQPHQDTKPLHTLLNQPLTEDQSPMLTLLQAMVDHHHTLTTHQLDIHTVSQLHMLLKPHQMEELKPLLNKPPPHHTEDKLPILLKLPHTVEPRI